MARTRKTEVSAATSSPLPASQVPLAGYASRAYLEYAMSVVKGRALPDARDGLKPVQRRILYAMQDLRLDHTAKPKKAARTVGQVIGQFHPHGDSSVYEAMVLLSQSFKLRYPLVHGEGNFGDMDDPKSYAAMRYTEARLAPIASVLLDELKYETVDFQPNYDGTLTEPALLPARLPFLLLNATPGIAVGMATSFIPHQLNEIVAAARLVMTRKRVSLDDIMAVVPGPDFPTGGTLISQPEDIRRAYETGSGSLRVRCKWSIEQRPRGQWALHVSELPPDVSPTRLLEALGDRMDPQPSSRQAKGSKQPTLSLEQQRTKKLLNELLIEFKDLSADGKVDLVFVPRDKGMQPEDFLRILCAYTDLEKTVPVNMVAVDASGTARCAGLLDWLRQWCDFRLVTVRRRTEHEHRRATARRHILRGRLAVMDAIDEAIRIIRTADEPKPALMQRFGLDEVQAEDVLEIRLRQLARMERERLLAELAELDKRLAELDALLADEGMMRRLIVKEMDADAKRFGDTRRTVLAPAAASTLASVQDTAVVADKVGPDPVAVAITERGWLVWRPAKPEETPATARANNGFKVKEGDAVRRVFTGDRRDTLFLVDEQGKGYSLALSQLASRADTAPFTTWLEPRARIVEGGLGGASSRFLMATSGGFGFILPGSAWQTRTRAGKDLVTLTPGATPLPPHPLPAEPGQDAALCVVCLATDGRALAFPLADVNTLPRGKGVGFMGFSGDASMADVAVLAADAPIPLLTPKGARKAVAPADWADIVAKRAAGKKGRRLAKESPGGVFDRAGHESVHASG